MMIGYLLLIAGALLMIRRFQIGDGIVTLVGPSILDLPSPDYDNAIRHMAIAIGRAEGFFVSGSVAARNHNPGNLKAEGIPGEFPRDARGFVVFSNDDQGWAALHHQLDLIVRGRSSFYRLDMTIDQMGAVWEADIGNAWARNVAASLGVTTDTTLRQVLV